MTVITTPLGALGLLAVAYVGLLFANFSRRLSAVTKMTSYHRWFLVGNILIVLAGMSQIILGIAELAPEAALPILLSAWFPLVSFHIPLAVGVSIDCVLVWYYWGWILREKVK